MDCSYFTQKTSDRPSEGAHHQRSRQYLPGPVWVFPGLGRAVPDGLSGQAAQAASCSPPRTTYPRCSTTFSPI